MYVLAFSILWIPSQGTGEEKYKIKMENKPV